MNNKTIDPESSTSSEIDLENFRASVAFPLEKLQEIVYNDRKQSVKLRKIFIYHH